MALLAWWDMGNKTYLCSKQQQNKAGELKGWNQLYFVPEDTGLEKEEFGTTKKLC